MRLRKGQFEKPCESNLKENLTAESKSYLLRRIHRVESDDSFDTIKIGFSTRGGEGPKTPSLYLLPPLIDFYADV